LLAPVLWACRVWALPFFSAQAPSERCADERGKHHKPLTEWAWQLWVLVRRWQPGREIGAVADGGYASLKPLDRCRRLKNPITFITRLRLEAALYELATPRKPAQKGNTWACWKTRFENSGANEGKICNIVAGGCALRSPLLAEGGDERTLPLSPTNG
jgi:hypothetical protein